LTETSALLKRVKIFFKLLAIASAMVLLSLMIIRLEHNSIETIGEYDFVWLHKRYVQALEALPGILKSGNKVNIVIGASDVQVGFVPQAFDQRAHELGENVVSYNFGFEGISANMVLILARRIAFEAQQSGVKPYLITLIFSPDRTTLRRTETRFGTRDVATITSVMYNRKMFFEDLLSDPETVLDAFFDKLGGNPGSAYWITETTLRRGLERFGLPEQFKTLWDSRESHGEPAWDAKQRGAFFFNVDRKPEIARAVEEVATDERLRKDYILFHRKCCGIVDLNFDQEQIQDFIEALALLKKNSENVVFTTMPYDPRFVRPAEATLRLNETLERIHREAETPYVRINENALAIDDYMDVIHFNVKGREKYSSLLATETFEKLRNPNFKNEY
jgi:hypothetical protein